MPMPCETSREARMRIAPFSHYLIFDEMRKVVGEEEATS